MSRISQRKKTLRKKLVCNSDEEEELHAQESKETPKRLTSHKLSFFDGIEGEVCTVRTIYFLF